MSVSLKNEALKFFDLELGLTEEQKECFKNELSRFCLSGSKEDAFSVYYCYSEIFKIFGKENTLQELVRLLSDHEYHSGELLQKHRDHFSHSVYVFTLGLAIYANNENYRKIVGKFYKNFTHLDFLKCWGFVGLFHDIGYPFQLAYEQVSDYMKEVFGKGDNPMLCYRNIDKLLTLSEKWQKQSGFDVNNMNELLSKAINKRMPYLAYEKVLEKLIARPSDKEYMDHAYFSSLLLANKLQEKEIDLSDSLLDSLTAILLHNSLIRFYLAVDDPSIPKTKAEVHPLAYLLMLCDEIQCWDRESFGLISKKKPIAWDFNIAFDKNRVNLIYTFDTHEIGKDENGNPLYENKNANKIIASKNESGLLKDICTAVEPHLEINPSILIKKKERKLNANASSNLLLNLEKIAVASHASYLENFNGYPSVAREFESLSLFHKLDNIDQAKSFGSKLNLINCLYSEKELDYNIVKEFSENEAEYLSIVEHVRWVKNRINYGWTYGVLGEDYTKENRDFVKKHCSMIPYALLSKEEKKKDLVVMNNMINFLENECKDIKVYSFKNNWKPIIRIVGTGHRNIDLSNKEEVAMFKQQIKDIFQEYQKTNMVVLKSNFARGSDMLIAEVASELGVLIDACLPFSYEDTIKNIKEDSKVSGYIFDKEDELQWRNLVAQAIYYNEIEPGSSNPYEAALKYNIDKSSVLLALWDGNEIPLTDSEGNPINRGGTFHSIVLAKQKGLRIHTIKCKRMN